MNNIISIPAETAALFNAMKSLCVGFSFRLKGNVLEEIVGQPCNAVTKEMNKMIFIINTCKL